MGKGASGAGFLCAPIFVTKYAGRPPKTLTGAVLAPSLAWAARSKKTVPPDFDLFSRLRLMFASAFLDNS